MNLLILAANGQIARIVEDQILKEEEFADVHLTLGLRGSDRLDALRGQSPSDPGRGGPGGPCRGREGHEGPGDGVRGHRRP